MERPATSTSEESSVSTPERKEYPLNTDDYRRLYKGPQDIGRCITQTLVPALCDVETVIVTEHKLHTMPLSFGLRPDPESRQFEQ